MMARGPTLLAAYLAGDPAANEAVREAMADWLTGESDSPASLLARLGLPGTRRSNALALRDAALVAAAVVADRAVPASRRSTYARAKRLQTACRLFAAHPWPAWQRLPAAPAHANALESVLFTAFKRHAAAYRDGSTPGEWSLSQFRALVQDLAQKSA